jgi:hypothetical protein
MSEATGGAILTASYRVIPVGVTGVRVPHTSRFVRHAGASLQPDRAVRFDRSVY